MANQEQLDFLKRCIDKGEVGITEWNKWREEHPEIKLDLRDANLREVDLRRANLNKANLIGANLWMADLRRADLNWASLCVTNLRGADLRDADLWWADLRRADLSWAKLRDANLRGAVLWETDLWWADLSKADLNGADLRGADLSKADLSGADLGSAQLSDTNLTNADLTGCWIYGVSVWNVQLEGAKQKDLIITKWGDEPEITVDNLEVAQFIYLLLHNQKIRQVIDTITSKVVLVLGRFTSERKAVLDTLRDELRNHNYSPIVFDFEKPSSRDLTETVSILARLSRFIIADITDPSCIPQELYAVVPDCIVPVQPLLSSQPVLIDGNDEERRPYSMFKDLQRRYHWVLPTYRYQDTNQLLSSIKDNIITPAEEKGKELERRKNGSI